LRWSLRALAVTRKGERARLRTLVVAASVSVPRVKRVTQGKKEGGFQVNLENGRGGGERTFTGRRSRSGTCRGRGRKGKGEAPEAVR